MMGSNRVLMPYPSTRLDMSVDLREIGFIVHVDVFISVHVDMVLLDLSLQCLEAPRGEPPLPRRCLTAQGTYHRDVFLAFRRVFSTWSNCHEFGLGL